ncbi:hypothetical protein [Massilia endophytica]|uniref:hypothetical protein n=1 Tax=Massilia endophytica TaxID=2899220 RepID=UPI001E607660|nr:hypothetical protein [Massilia endophytica]UGQ46245.1 hypothetical protein LSQ66_21150 [Massilia endophytica]
MEFKLFKKTAFVLALFAAFSAGATPLMEMRAEDLLPMAPDLKASLKLNANQSTLWAQTESRTRTLLRERQSRRERLQAASKQALEGKDVELRDLNGAMEAEQAATAAEEKQLREWWLTVNDALDESQRRAVAVFLVEQLQRVEGPMRPAAPRPEGGEGRAGGHRGGHGGAGGMGGGGPGRN